MTNVKKANYRTGTKELMKLQIEISFLTEITKKGNKVKQ